MEDKKKKKEEIEKVKKKRNGVSHEEIRDEGETVLRSPHSFPRLRLRGVLLFRSQQQYYRVMVDLFPAKSSRSDIFELINGF